ncbi:MAG: hypothetical protein PHS59_03025 [Paludibacter sp.]|nr:hypothetical protein [Paludibacter sp.]
MKDKTKRIFLAFGKMIKTQLTVNHSDLSEFKSVFSIHSISENCACLSQAGSILKYFHAKYDIICFQLLL